MLDLGWFNVSIKVIWQFCPVHIMDARVSIYIWYHFFVGTYIWMIPSTIACTYGQNIDFAVVFM